MYPTLVVLLALVTGWEKVWSAPVPLRIVDLTHVFDNTTLNFPGLRPFRSSVSFVDVGTVTVQIEEFSSATHVGTHMDAPCHVVPGRQRVTEIPLDRLVAPAAVVDIRDRVAFNRDYELQIDDLLDWEATTGVLLNDVILLVRSGWSKYWSNRTAFMGNRDNDGNNFHFPGVAPSASQWLVNNRNVYGVGVEPMSLDYGPSQDFRTHIILLSKNIYGLESMDCMDELPLFGATLHVMPMKIGGGACGAPTRIFATFPDMPTRRPAYGLKDRRNIHVTRRPPKSSSRWQNLFLK